MHKTRSITTLYTILLFLTGATLLALPLVIAPRMTDPVQLPKEVIVLFIALIGILLWSGAQAFQKSIVFQRNSSDTSILIYGALILVGSLFSIYMSDSFLWTAPIVGVGIITILINQVIKTQRDLTFLLLCLLTGIGATAVIAILSFFSIFVYPFTQTHSGAFSPTGSLLDQAVLLAIGIAILAVMFVKRLRAPIMLSIFGIFLPLVLFLFGEGLTVLKLFTTEKLLFLPFAQGFQIGFSTISQDTGRLLQAFIFGSGPGTFAIDFMRFKPVSINAYNDLWFLSFTTSTSLFLELLATTGLSGLVGLLFLFYSSIREIRKDLSNPLGYGLLVSMLAIIFLPISFLPFATFFVLFALTALANRLKTTHAQPVEVSLVMKKNQQFSFSSILPITLFVIGLLVTIATGYYAITYVHSDLAFEDSIAAANANNGALAYHKQVEAITAYGYKDSYDRVFSQTSLSLANSLLALNASKNSSPSASARDQALQLVQQSITTARAAITLSPFSSINWQNLAVIYRNLIGIGQGADTFAISSWQQAISLDPSNPQEYLNLGGVYYQLGQWDKAIGAFQQAINLKSDYANAYYNLGHAYEQKGDLQNAMKSYQSVSNITITDQSAQQQIKKDIAALQQKIDQGQTQAQKPATKTGTLPLVVSPTPASGQ